MSVAKKIKAECCGCNTCVEICPKKCISMQHDKVGFLYPIVDESICIECGACERVCPFPAKDSDLNYPVKAFAGWAKDDKVHSRSSSGGAAYVISRKTIENGGVVYGCASEGLTIKHIRIESPDELPKLQGSKYVQSDVGGLFSQVKTDLKSGRQVTFIGMPCQVAGLKKFIKNSPENLLLVDLVCHGTPSQQMLRDHVEHVAGTHKIDKISFRQGNDFELKLFSDGHVVWSCNVWQQPFKDMYYRGFIDGTTYRPSCNICSFGRPERVSDITIGDFWGLKVDNLYDNPYNLGTSVILPSTEKGLAMVESLKDEISLVERPVAEAIEGNDQLRHPLKKTKKGKVFYALYPHVSFDTAMKAVSIRQELLKRLKRVLRPLRPVLQPILNVVRR